MKWPLAAFLSAFFVGAVALNAFFHPLPPAGQVLALPATVAAGEFVDGLKIVGETKYKPHALVRLKAEGHDPKAGLLWRIYPSKDVQKATTARNLLEFTAHPGTYEVELLAISRGPNDEMLVDEVKVTVTIEGCSPVPPQPNPPNPTPPNPPGGGPGHGTLDPVQALGKIRFGNAGCTATVIGPRRGDGRWDVLTAAHCIEGNGQKGTLAMKDGRTFNVTVVANNTKADLAWLVTDEKPEAMPYAKLAETAPAVGTKMWHMGFGVDQPGNREDGEVVAGVNSDGQIQMFISVSSGDSGGGMFRSDTNELISVVCCTTAKGRKAQVWGGSSLTARALRPGSTFEELWTEFPLFLYPPEPKDKE